MSLRRTVTYVDNRGQEHNVRHMNTSHIMNVLKLIKDQQQAIDWFQTDFINEKTVDCLYKSLNADAKILCGELNRRYKKVGCKGLKETA